MIISPFNCAEMKHCNIRVTMPIDRKLCDTTVCYVHRPLGCLIFCVHTGTGFVYKHVTYAIYAAGEASNKEGIDKTRNKTKQIKIHYLEHFLLLPFLSAFLLRSEKCHSQSSSGSPGE